MIYFKGQKKHSSSWAQMVKYSTLRTEMGLRKRKGKTMKDKMKRRENDMIPSLLRAAKEASNVNG